VTLMMQYMVVMGIPLMATGCGYECTVLYVTFMKVKSFCFFLMHVFLNFFLSGGISSWWKRSIVLTRSPKKL
jgi:hypothetical protein